MGYVGVPPQSGFITTAKQRVTSSTNNYVDLDHSISSLADVIVWVNFVKQDSTNLSLTTSTRITLGGTLVASDIVEIAYLGKAVATQTPATGTVTNDMLATPTTINNNADNRVITGSGTANTLEGEANLTYNGSNLGVNIASPTMIAGTGMHLTSSGSDCRFHISNNTVGDTANDGAYIFMGSDGTLGFLNKENASNVFYTNGSERMRVTSGGNVGIGDSSPSGALEVSNTSTEIQIMATGNSSTNELIRWNNTNTSSTNHTISFFKRNGATTGSIAHTNNSTSFNTSSDYRLKENEVAISDGITRLKTLKPYRFNFKTDADKTVDGFFAHEVSSVVPEAISGNKDAVDSEGNIEPQAIDQSKLVPLLTSALQEAITKIETLEARVQTLENA